MQNFLRTTETTRPARAPCRASTTRHRLFAREQTMLCAPLDLRRRRRISTSLAPTGWPTSAEKPIVVRDRGGEIRAHYNVCRPAGPGCAPRRREFFQNDPARITPGVPPRRTVDRRTPQAGTPGFPWPTIHSTRAVGQWEDSLRDPGANPEPIEDTFAPVRIGSPLQPAVADVVRRIEYRRAN